MRIARLAVIAAAAAAAALATTALAAPAPCQTAGEKSARPLRLDPTRDGVGYTTWAFALDPVLTPQVLALAKPEVTCLRGQFLAAGETYTLTGENTEFFPRRAIPVAPGKAALFVAPVADLTKVVGDRLGVSVRYQPGASYVLIRLDEHSATAVRIYKKLPTDDVLLRDLTDVVETGGQPFAQMLRPDGKVAIIVSRPPSKP